MEVHSEYRARPLHLSGQGLAAQLRHQHNQPKNQHSPLNSNQPVPLSPNTLLAFQNPEDIEQHIIHRIPQDPVTSPGYADGQAIFDLYNNSPSSPHFTAGQEASAEAGPSDLGRQPSIRLVVPEEEEHEGAYGGTEEAEEVAERGSWNSGYSEGQGGGRQVRGSTMSAMTMESEMDPFAFSKYTSGPLQRKLSAKHAPKPSAASARSGLPTIHSPPSSTASARSPSPSALTPLAPAVAVTSPSLSSPPDALPPHPARSDSSSRTPPQQSQPHFASSAASAASSPPPPQAGLAASDVLPPAGVLAGRAKSHSPIKNYSRPNFSRPILRERENSAGSATDRPQLTPLMARSDSNASYEGRPGQAGESSVGHGSATSASVSLNRSDSNGYGGSSTGHGSSVQSHGGASVSASWEERQQWDRPSFEQQATYYSHSPRAGSLSSSRLETLRPDGTIHSPQLSDTYGPLYPAGSPAMSRSPSSESGPALAPPPTLGKSASSSPPSSPRPRNVLRKARPVEPPLSPPKEKEHGGWFRSRAKSRSPQPVPVPKFELQHQPAISSPEFDRGTVDPRASYGTMRTDATGVTSTSFVPRTQRDWGLTPQEARRRAQERQAQEQMSLQPGVGKRTAAGFVHRGEAGLAPEWLAVEQIKEEDEVESLHALGLSLPPGHSRAGSQASQGAQSMRAGPSAGGSGSGPGDDSRSLYSKHSYYTLDESNLNSPMPSPNPDSSPMLQQKALVRQSTTLEKTKAGLVGRAPRVALTPAEAQSPEDFLQLGIELHEGGELERSAWCFEQSTKRDGGCGAGFLMYGLALRHGWGCQMQPELGFSYLQRAAESVVGELSQFSPGSLPDLSAQSAARTAVVLALYEMGTSFRFGWGTAKDKKMAVEYFTMAAELGDVDAQSDLAFCWANGKGCKKDMRKAARYYRMAVAQGGESFGLSWIYKPKYMDT